MSSDCGGTLSAYEPPPSLWELVQRQVPVHEQTEVKGMLGESFVEQSLELHEEVDTLLSIWRDYKAETEQVLQINRLPEPPAQRQLLTQEICFYIQSIREKADKTGRNATTVLDKYNPRVIDYALDGSRPSSSNSRPSTSCSSRTGLETPVLLQSSSSTPRRASSSALSEDMDTLSGQLNPFRLEDVVDHLRKTLEEEVNQLLSDIQFLQGCLDEEADYRCESSLSREPTLTDLREERTRLEKDLLSTEAAVPKCMQDQMHLCTVKRPVEQSFKPAPPGSTPHSIGPLKANHRISTQIKNIGGVDSKLHITDNIHVSEKRTSEKHVHVRDKKGQAVYSSEGGTVCADKSVLATRSGQPTHLNIATSGLPRNKKLVHMGSITSPSSREECIHIPSPPSAGKPTGARPGSASRFRKMVIQCRDN